ARARILNRIVDGRQLPGLELHVDDGTDHLDDLALAHVPVPFCARLTTLMPPATRPCLGSKGVCARLTTLMPPATRPCLGSKGVCARLPMLLPPAPPPYLGSHNVCHRLTTLLLPSPTPRPG